MDYKEVNRANWDDRVAIHVASDFYNVDAFKAGGQTLTPFQMEEVGDLTGRSLVHLQCHFGLDTLSLARLGARVTGLDLSQKAIDVARELAADCGIEARFVAAELYDAEEALGDTYDMVFTGMGALCWLPDLTRWAQIVAALLKPGGVVYLSEFHPFADVLDDDEGATVAYDYFDTSPHVWDEPHTYTGSEVLEHTVSVQFQHPMSEVITSLAAAGLRLEYLREYDYTLFQRFKSLVSDASGYRYPEGRPRIPMMYSLRAHKDIR